MGLFSRFYKKTRTERIEALHRHHNLSKDSLATLAQDTNLSPGIAGKMVENHLGTFALPFAVVPDMLVDGTTYSLPLVTEEPSVVAACSFGAKVMARSGGVVTTIHNRLMIGQVALTHVSQPEKAKEAIQAASQDLLNAANQAHPSIATRGGGARRLTIDEKGGFLIVYLQVDVQEAMGANMLNTMLEAIAPLLEALTGGETLMGILSNYATESLVSACCRIPFSHLSTPGYPGQEVARKIALASQLAQVDPYRATTHNKGIFNGVDALVLATGNDWRAIEAGGHAYASRNGSYRGLSQWTIEEDTLVGQLTLPLPLASVGGSIGLNPKVAVAFDLIGHPTAKQLASLAAATGLCQNFAALRALVTTGIQKGHMKLHIQSLALLAGASEEEVEPLSHLLNQEPHRNLETAKTLLASLRKHSQNQP